MFDFDKKQYVGMKTAHYGCIVIDAVDYLPAFFYLA